jgi:DNA-binding MurR/RpiR family transcriptional regulator
MKDTISATRPAIASSSGTASAACVPPSDLTALKQRLIGNSRALSKVTTRIARFALENPAEIAMSNGRKIANLLAVSPSSVTRFATALGFQNYAELRRFFQREVIKARQARN